MFGKKIWILAIADGKLIAARVNIRSKKVVKSVMYDWSPGELSKTLRKIKNAIKTNKVRVLLADDLSYFLGVLVPEDLTGEDKREYIKSKLKERVPEKLKKNQWDYKEAGYKGEKRKVVVFAPVKRIYLELMDGIEKSGIIVEAIESESISVTRHENPIVGLALKLDIKGEDDEVLNIQLNDDKKVVEHNVKKGSARKRFSIFLKLAVTIALAVITVGSAYYYFQVRGTDSEQEEASADGEQSQITEITAEPTASSEILTDTEPTEEPVSLSEYSISILNGSGVAGEAGYVEEILLAEGFENTDTGNADEQDNVFTTVSLVTSAPEVVRDTIERALNDEYELEFVEVDEEQEFDVIVIVGSRLEE